MKYFLIAVLLATLISSCAQEEITEQQAVTGGLQKLENLDESQIKELEDSGAEIIVHEADYIVIRTTNMTKPLAFSSTPIQESDLVQRLVHIHLKDSLSLQTVINSGVDFWQVDGDTAIARAFDLYIKKLQAEGLTVRIVAQDATKWMEGQK